MCHMTFVKCDICSLFHREALMNTSKHAGVVHVNEGLLVMFSADVPQTSVVFSKL